jgi:FtsX-like permease family
VINEFAADQLGLHIGEKEHLGIFSNAQLGTNPDPTVPAQREVTLTIAGIGIFSDEVVQDDVDRLARVLISPELSDQFADCCGSYAWIGVQLKRGAAGVLPFLNTYHARFPDKPIDYFHITSVDEGQAEQSVKPEALALGVFGLIAGMAALIIAAQLIARQVRNSTQDREVMRLLGADPVDTTLDGLLGIVAALVLGSVLAAAVAVALSPLAPFGPVRAVEPHHAITFDWTVLTLGALALLAITLAMAVLFSFRDAAHRVSSRRLTRPSRLVAAAESVGFPPPATTGIRFALEPGRGRNAVPVRSTIMGTVLAVAVVVASLTFGNSLNTLITHPALYGWNWNYILESNAGYGAAPTRITNRLLASDHDVAGFTGGYYSFLTIDGQSLPVLGESPGGTVQPSLLTGHGLEASNQVVLGTESMEQLHKRLGDSVEVDYGAQHKTAVIVGTATMPTVGVGHGLHLSMGTGALLDYELIPSSVRDIQGEGVGPNVYFIRLKSDHDTVRAERSLNKIANEISNASNDAGGVMVYPVQHPAQIVNYRSMGSTPELLAGALAAGAISALGLTLWASVRRRRRDMALLKTLGFTGRQLASVVAWQATIAAVIGSIIGVPLGIVVGRSLWVLFARELYAVPHPSVSVPAMALVVIVAVVLANLVAAIPGVRAARTPTALVLRSE